MRIVPASLCTVYAMIGSSYFLSYYILKHIQTMQSWFGTYSKMYRQAHTKYCNSIGLVYVIRLAKWRIKHALQVASCDKCILTCDRQARDSHEFLTKTFPQGIKNCGTRTIQIIAFANFLFYALEMIMKSAQYFCLFVKKIMLQRAISATQFFNDPMKVTSYLYVHILDITYY